jgi:hypothetical protein
VFPACVAVTTHVPVPLVIVTVFPEIVQTPETPTVTVSPEVDDADAVNWLLFAAVDGTPLNVIV